MRCFDITFLIDFVRGDQGAREHVSRLLDAGEKLTIPAVAAAELLVGANFHRGSALNRAMEFLESLEVIPFGASEAAEAGRIGAEALRKGSALCGVDLLVAASARHHRGILVSRDKGLVEVPGLSVESY